MEKWRACPIQRLWNLRRIDLDWLIFPSDMLRRQPYWEFWAGTIFDLHLRFGTNVAITSLFTDLDIPGDTKIEEKLCINCDFCMTNCLANALDEAGKTDVPKCVANSQPYGRRTNIVFCEKYFNFVF